MQLKKLIILFSVVLLLAAGGYYFFTTGATNKTPAEKQSLSALTEVVKKDTSIFDALIPAATGYVNDFGYYFTPKQSDTLTRIIQQHEKNTSDQIAIVTFNTLPIEEKDFDAFTKALANKWGVGQKEKNNGIVIALCKNIRKIRIQNGDGITPKLSDNATKAIIEEVIFPEFRKGDYYAGVKNGLLSIIAKLN